ncbi:MAG: hypothetical protein K6F78_07060 [Bacteroidaceae bacterium]|nr:hypothetical protein [Bacteroidaceae bacterium]
MEEKAKRVVQIEIDDQVKKLTIEGVDKDQQVVMRQELSDEELDTVAGGTLKVQIKSCPTATPCIVIDRITNN